MAAILPKMISLSLCSKLHPKQGDTVSDQCDLGNSIRAIKFDNESGPVAGRPAENLPMILARYFFHQGSWKGLWICFSKKNQERWVWAPGGHPMRPACPGAIPRNVQSQFQRLRPHRLCQQRRPPDRVPGRAGRLGPNGGRALQPRPGDLLLPRHPAGSAAGSPIFPH